MSLWNTRSKAIAEFDGPLKVEAEVLSEAFDLLDECVVRLETEHGSQPYSRVCALTLIKGRNLLLGSYSLSLDGLAQEAGALLRPFIDVFEKMVYFNEYPLRTEEAIEGRLPKEGEIAKRIQGQFKTLREHLNQHSSHFGFTDDSANHLIDWNTLKLKRVQPYSRKVLRTNLKNLPPIGCWEDDVAGRSGVGETRRERLIPHSTAYILPFSDLSFSMFLFRQFRRDISHESSKPTLARFAPSRW